MSTTDENYAASHFGTIDFEEFDLIKEPGSWDDEWLAGQMVKGLELHHSHVRWSSGQQPTVYLPGDVPVVRYLHTAWIAMQLKESRKIFAEVLQDSHVNRGIEWFDGIDQALAQLPLDERDRVQDAISMMQVYGTTLASVYEAVPFYLNPSASQAILGSHRPDPELIENIRLPFDSVLVLFGAPMRYGPASGWLDGFKRMQEQFRGSHYGRFMDEIEERMLQDKPGFDQVRPDPTKIMSETGGGLSGVVLFRDPRGTGLANTVIYLTLTPSPTHPGEDNWGATIGTRSDSAFAGIVENAASVVAWGGWSEPDPDALIPDSLSVSEFRKATRKGHHRRTEVNGVAYGVRVIDLAKTTSHTTTDHVPTGRSVAPHMRRGHWRRVRCGPRVDWHYEGRWIPPTMVNITAGLPTDRTVVYALPEPPEHEEYDTTVIDLTSP